MSDLIVVGIIFGSITITGIMSEKLQISPILFEIVIGLIFGPYVLGIVEMTDTLEFLQELGLIMLLFLAGLDFDFHNPMKKLKNILKLSVPSFVAGMIFYGILSLLSWFTPLERLFISIILATTSKSLTLSLLKDKLDTEGLYDTAVLANISKDILLITLASLILNVVSIDGSSGEIVLSVVLDIIILVVFVGIIGYITPKVQLYWFSRRYDKSKKHEWKIKFIFGVLGGLILIANFVNIELALAAYLAGIFVQTTSQLNKDDVNKLRGLGYGFLIPIFFFGVGMQIDPVVLLNTGSIGKILLIIFSIIILKVSIGLAVLHQFLKTTMKDKVITVLVYTTVSESLGFAILNLASNAGVIETDTYAIFAFILVTVQLLVIILVEFVNQYILKDLIDESSSEDE